MTSTAKRRAYRMWVVLAMAVSAAIFLLAQAHPAEATGLAAVSAGGDKTCALNTTGGVQCWGRNRGDGTFTISSAPADVCADAACTAPLAGVAAVSVGTGSHACALATAGGVKCWGANGFGQLGDGTTTGRLTPVDVCADATCTAPLNGIVAVSAGEDGHTCARTTTGGVKCWGRNDFGQLGDGTTTARLTPVDVCADATCATPLSDVFAVSAERVHTCALTSAGRVKCWGQNDLGQLGDGTTTGRLTPVDVCADATCTAPLSGIAAVSVGSIHSCALTTTAGVKCWGWNGFGQLGDGTTTARLTPVDVCADATCATPLSGAAAISAGGAPFEGHTCAETTAGGIKCWGGNGRGQLGDGTNTWRSTPVDVCADATCTGALSDVSAVSAGRGHTCALTMAGRVKCWGRNDLNQLGDGTTTDRSTPVAVIGLDAKKVGGFSVDLAGDETGLSLETAQSSGTNAGLLAGVIGAVSAVAIMVTGAAWYARRRLIR